MARNNRVKIIISAIDKGVRGTFKKVAGGLLKLGSTAVLGAIAATVAAVGALAVVVGKTANEVDKLAKDSDKLGIPIEQLQALNHAGELAGISTETMSMAMQRMTRRLAEAAKGTGEAKGAIEELGLDAEKLANMTPDKALQTIITALEGVENQSDKVRLAFKFFDSEGVSMVNMTTEGIKEAQKEMEKFGVLTREQAGDIEEMNDAFSRFQRFFKSIFEQITAELAPLLESMWNGFVEVGQKIKDVFSKTLDILKPFFERLSKDFAGTFDTAKDKAKSFAVFLIRMIPTALIAVIDMVGKVGLAFSGWKLIFNGLKQAWLALQILMQEGIKKLAEGLLMFLKVHNLNGVFDSQIAAAEKVIQHQDKIITTLDTGLRKAGEEQKGIMSGIPEHEQKIESYKKEVAGLQAQFDDLSKAMGDGTEKAVKKSNTQIDSMIGKLKELQKQQKLVSMTPGSVDLSSVDGFSFGNINDQIDKADKTQ